jgi:hypothetical protein
MPGWPGGIHPNNQQVVELALGFQLHSEGTLMVAVREKNPGNEIEKGNIMIARNHQDTSYPQAGKKVVRRTKLTTARTLRNVPGEYDQIRRLLMCQP